MNEMAETMERVDRDDYYETRGKVVCWHCSGTGLCSCISCWNAITASAGKCKVCEAREKKVEIGA